MKKIIIGIFTIIALTGCGNKIKCTNNTDNDVMKQNITYNIYKKENSITKITTKENYEIHNEQINENYDYVLNFKFEDYKTNNIDYKYNHKDNKYNIETTFEIEKMNEETINLYIGTKDANEYKTKLIDSGYICK